MDDLAASLRDATGVSDAQLRLAARLGDARACEAFPTVKPLVDPSEGDLSSDESMELALRGWIVALCSTREASARAALAVSRRALGFFSRLLPRNTRASAALEATRAWIGDPIGKHVVKAESAEAGVALAVMTAREIEIPRSDAGRAGWPLSASLAARSAQETVQTVFDPRHARRAAAAANWFRLALVAIAANADSDTEDWGDDDDDALRPDVSLADRRRIVEVIQDLIKKALLPWALGQDTRA